MIGLEQPVREPSISLASLSAVTGPGWRMRVIEAYYDNSGKPQDPRLAWTTLAGVIAPEESWRIFDAKWLDAMGDRRYLHMKELNKRNPPSDSPYWGMSEYDKQVLLTKAAGAFLQVEQEEFQVFGVVCTADKAAYAKATDAGLNVPSLAEACGEVCFWHIIERFGRGDDISIKFFYDVGEQQFFKRILNDWDNRKKRATDPTISKLPVKPSPVADMRKVPGIQVADFIAWHVYQSYAQDAPEIAFLGTHNLITKHVELNEDYWFGRPQRGLDENFARWPKRAKRQR